MKITKAALLAIVLASQSFAQQNDRPAITLGPGYKKGQVSQRKLLFVLPAGWVLSQDAAEKSGIYAVGLPKGKTLDNSDAMITIAFQKKDPKTPGLDSLVNFVRTDIQNTQSQFPDLEAARWQPSGLNPDTVGFMSLELFGKKPGQPSPHHVVFIDEGDGYFSIVLMAKTLSELSKPPFEAFFNSIRLE